MRCTVTLAYLQKRAGNAEAVAAEYSDLPLTLMTHSQSSRKGQPTQTWKLKAAIGA